VRASTSFGAQTGRSNSNVAKFICAQIVRLWMSPAELDFNRQLMARVMACQKICASSFPNNICNNRRSEETSIGPQ
jgi:hypothetical protein